MQAPTGLFALLGRLGIETLTDFACFFESSSSFLAFLEEENFGSGEDRLTAVAIFNRGQTLARGRAEKDGRANRPGHAKIQLFSFFVAVPLWLLQQRSVCHRLPLDCIVSVLRLHEQRVWQLRSSLPLLYLLISAEASSATWRGFGSSTSPTSWTERSWACKTTTT